MDLGPGLAMSVLFVSVAAVFILRGPLGRAMGERIAGHSLRAGADDGEIANLHAAVDELRGQLDQVQERLDFAERLLARRDARPELAPGERQG